MPSPYAPVSQPIETFIRILAPLNDLLLLSSPWIYSPSSPSASPYTPSPFFLTLAYSILEPLLTRLVLLLGPEDPVLGWLGLFHVVSGPVAMAFNARLIFDAAGSGKIAETAGLGAQQLLRRPVGRRLRDLFLADAVWLFPLCTAASWDVVLLLWAADRHPFGRTIRIRWIALTGQICGLVFMFGSRIWDFGVARGMSRPMWIGQAIGGRSYLGTQVGLLVLGWGLRAGVRAWLGLDPLLAFRKMDEGVLEGMRDPFYQNRWKGLGEELPFVQSWMWLAPTFFMFILIRWVDKQQEKMAAGTQ